MNVRGVKKSAYVLCAHKRWPWHCRGYRSRRSSVLIRTVVAPSSFVDSAPHCGVQYIAIQVVQKLTLLYRPGRIITEMISFTIEFPAVPIARPFPFYPDAVFLCHA